MRINQKIITSAISFLRSEEGVAMTEYLLLLGAIAGAGALFITFFGTTIGTVLTDTCNTVFGAGTCAAATP